MNLSTRLDKLERNLSPREVAILWMQEAHQFDSTTDYVRWLLEQPHESHPLPKMAKQMAAAAEVQLKGRPSAAIVEELSRAKKQLLFLYYLHEQLNLRAELEAEGIQLRVMLLGEKQRSLLLQVGMEIHLRFERFNAPKDPGQAPAKRPGRKSKAELELDAEIATWAHEETCLRREILAFREAAQLLSGRYLGGHELLFPAAARRLKDTLDKLAGLRDLQNQVVPCRPPRSDKDFFWWMLKAQEDEGAPTSEKTATKPASGKEPDVSAEAHRLAGEIMLLAKAETFLGLGDKDAALSLVKDWTRQVDTCPSA
jgi:hypothetical protein